MTNFVQRFREREILPLMMEVPLQVGDDRFVFSIRRFAQEEFNAARKDTQRDARERGADPETMSRDDFGYLFAVNLAKYIVRHIKGWTHSTNNGTAPFLFSEPLLNDLFSEMSESELSGLGFSYLFSLQGLNKKKDDSEISHPKTEPPQQSTEKPLVNDSK